MYIKQSTCIYKTDYMYISENYHHTSGGWGGGVERDQILDPLKIKYQPPKKIKYQISRVRKKIRYLA